MKSATQRASPGFVLLAIPVLVIGGVAFAENIDPGNDGSRYAWAENLGWINLQPSGPGGPGVQVSDSDLTGWAWSENVGWVSLSCTNRSCAGGSYGVTNDGCGTLAGHAWSENAGWINFAPTGEGVTIDPQDGDLQWAGLVGERGVDHVLLGRSQPVPCGDRLASGHPGGKAKSCRGQGWRQRRAPLVDRAVWSDLVRRGPGRALGAAEHER